MELASTIENSVVQVTRAFARYSTKRFGCYHSACLVLSVIRSISRLLLPFLKAGCLPARFHETVCMTNILESWFTHVFTLVSAMKKRLEKEAMEKGDDD